MDVRPVTTEDEVEIVRQIRNAGRQWMTRHTDEISPAQQRAWWAGLDHAGTKLYLFSIAVTPIGYGMLRLLDGRVWCSLAVWPHERGQGHGTAIYRYLAHCQLGWDVWAEIYADNTPSLRAALRAGYTLAYAQDKVATLVHRKGER